MKEKPIYIYKSAVSLPSSMFKIKTLINQYQVKYNQC